MLRRVKWIKSSSDEGDTASYRAPDLHRCLRESTHARLPIVGGVSSTGLGRGEGSQFAGSGVRTDSVAAALLECDVRSGISIAHGLTPTDRVYQVKQLADEGRTVAQFEQGAPAELFAGQEPPVLLGLESPEGECPVIEAVLEGNSLHLLKPISERSTVRVLDPQPEHMKEAGWRAVDGAVRRMRINPLHVTGFLGFACKARYRDREKIGLDVQEALGIVAGKSPGVPCVGAYVDGEAGLDLAGRSVIGNWCVAGVVFSDEMPGRAQFHWAFQALAEHGLSMARASSVRETISRALETIMAAGFPGTMLSLVLHNRGKQWIIAQEARGKGWPDIVSMTQRDLPGRDVLAQVADVGIPRFVPDSRKDEDCEPAAREKAGVISQYIAPLPDESGKTIGLLQVDLGDISDQAELLPEQRTVLESVTSCVATALNKAMRAEELELSRKLDRAVSECHSCDTVKEAIDRFIKAAAQAMGARMAHVRLADPRTRKLKLVAGVGCYYEAALKEREEIDFDDLSATGRTFRQGEVTFVNDADQNPDALKMMERYREGSLGDTLRQFGSFANWPLGEPAVPVIGMVNVADNEKWFFTRSRLRSLQDLGTRLYFVVMHVGRKESERRSEAKLRFLRAAAPHLGESIKLGLHAALREHVTHLREAARAHTVSCFLWDAERERFVLRAQAGWRDGRWVDAAWYSTRDDSMTGAAAQYERPRHIASLAEHKKKVGKGQGKYLTQMFGDDLDEDAALEVIALPLRAGDDKLGVVTMHRRISGTHREGETGFTTIDEEVLTEAADDLTAFVRALQYHEDTRWREEETARLERVDNVLLQHKPLDRLLQEASHCIVDVDKDGYGARCCIVYLANEDGTRLDPVTLATRGEVPERVPKPVGPGEGPPWDAFRSSEMREDRRPPDESQRDPKQVSREGLLERAYLPLQCEGSTLGVLKLSWQMPTSADRVEGRIIRHDRAGLERLADRVAMAIYARRIQEDREASLQKESRTTRALAGMASAVVQSAHRLGNLTQDILSDLRNLRESSLTGDQQEIVLAMDASGGSMLAELDRCRQIAVGLFRPVWERQAVHILLNEAIDELAPRIDSGRITLTLAVDPVIAEVERVQLTHAFGTIIRNAIEAMAEGGVLTIRCRHDDAVNRAVFEFKDTGKGIPSEQIKDILNGFVSYKERGIGVGLFLAKLCCEVHGGELTIQGEINKGTTVTMSLPTHHPKEES